MAVPALVAVRVAITAGLATVGSVMVVGSVTVDSVMVDRGVLVLAMPAWLPRRLVARRMAQTTAALARVLRVSAMDQTAVLTTLMTATLMTTTTDK